MFADELITEPSVCFVLELTVSTETNGNCDLFRELVDFRWATATTVAISVRMHEGTLTFESTHNIGCFEGQTRAGITSTDLTE